MKSSFKLMSPILLAALLAAPQLMAKQSVKRKEDPIARSCINRYLSKKMAKKWIAPKGGQEWFFSPDGAQVLGSDFLLFDHASSRFGSRYYYHKKYQRSGYAPYWDYRDVFALMASERKAIHQQKIFIKTDRSVVQNDERDHVNWKLTDSHRKRLAHDMAGLASMDHKAWGLSKHFSKLFGEISQKWPHEYAEAYYTSGGAIDADVIHGLEHARECYYSNKSDEYIHEVEKTDKALAKIYESLDGKKSSMALYFKERALKARLDDGVWVTGYNRKLLRMLGQTVTAELQQDLPPDWDKPSVEDVERGMEREAKREAAQRKAPKKVSYDSILTAE